MGMGEPMMNLDDVLDACGRLPDIGITNRRTAISTVGWIPGIERIAEHELPIALALSLHAPNDALRSQLMPVNDRFPLSDVLAACAPTTSASAGRFRRVRDARRRQRLPGQAGELAAVLDPRVFKVNLIPYNPTGSPYEGSGPKAIEAFRAELERPGIAATVRLTRGRDIDAACGQLAARARRRDPRDPTHARRLTAQLLSGAPARDALAVAERLLAIQGQDPRGARLAIRARSRGVTSRRVTAR